MGRPVIGLSTYVEPARWGAWEVPAALLHEWYVHAVREAGGRAVLLPPDSTDDDVLDRIDGLILIGGADVGPANYGAEPHSTVDAPRVERDASELLLCQGARSRDLPLLGICRGMQVMAIAYGGLLIQDLPDAGYGLIHREMPGTFTEHDVRFAPGSRIAEIYWAPTLSRPGSWPAAGSNPGVARPPALS